MFERFGSRWALQVLFALHERGILRFSELMRAVPGAISERMLASTVRDLEQAGLVARRVYPEVPPRVEYRFAPRTATLLPILHQLRAWAEEAEQPV